MMGIYRIFNTKNAKSYIGQSTNIDARFKSHKYELHRGRHRIMDLQNDWDEYGEEVFIFEVLEECERKDLSKLEQRYIRKLNTTNPESGYNTLKSQYVAANPNRELLKVRTHKSHFSKKDYEPPENPICTDCVHNCKQYITAEILFCPKMKGK